MVPHEPPEGHLNRGTMPGGPWPLPDPGVLRTLPTVWQRRAPREGNGERFREGAGVRRGDAGASLRQRRSGPE